MTVRRRICLLHNQIAPYRLPVFAEVGRQVDLDVLFCQGRARDRRWDTDLGGYAFGRTVLWSLRIGPFVVNPGLLFRLLRRRYDAYLVGDFPETALATFTAIGLAKLRRKPVVLWSETIDHQANLYGSTMARRLFTAGVTAYRRFLLRLPDRFVALSGAARLFLESEGVPADRIDSGIQVQPAELLAEPDVAKADSPYAGCRVILSLGYLNRTKGVDILITAFRELPGDDLRLVIAGAGDQEARLRRLARDDARIRFAGHVAGMTHANYFRWADIFVLPTLVDCWAMVVNEALHHGVPVIATTAAGAAELVADGSTGVLVPPGDPWALHAALEKLLADPPRLARMSAAARQRTDVTDSRVGAAPLLRALHELGRRR